jgi:hypothetical protein
MRCTLQVVGRLGRLRLAGGPFPFNGVCNPPIHPAAVQHGSHQIVLDGRVDLSLHYTLLAEAARMRCTLQVVG